MTPRDPYEAVVAPAAGTLRAALADAHHERWCGEDTANCSTECGGRIDRGSLDAICDAARDWFASKAAAEERQRQRRHERDVRRGHR